jgi:Cupredoxin-like domain
MTSWHGIAVTLGLAFVVGGTAVAQDVPTVELTIKDHRFNPTEIHVSPHTPIVLAIKNEDPIAEEFDSAALKVEKVIAGGGMGMVRLRPLDTGSYPFIGEYHAETAQGVVIVE